MCTQQLRSAGASAQVEKGLRCSPEDAFDPWLPIECPAKIGLRGTCFIGVPSDVSLIKCVTETLLLVVTTSSSADYGAFKGNGYIFRGDNCVEIVLPPFCKGMYSKRKYLLPWGVFFFLLEYTIFRIQGNKYLFLFRYTPFRVHPGFCFRILKKKNESQSHFLQNVGVPQFNFAQFL